MRGKTPLTRKKEDGSTIMQQDQIRASRLFILVNTTPRISILDLNTVQEFSTQWYLSITSATLASISLNISLLLHQGTLG